MAYDGIYINNTLIEHQPESYEPEDMWFGEVRRNIAGQLLQSNPEKIKKRFTISAITETQYAWLSQLANVKGELTFRDGIPITQESNTRTIHEVVTSGSGFITYVPLYRVRRVGFSPAFRGNERTYTLILEEI